MPDLVAINPLTLRDIRNVNVTSPTGKELAPVNRFAWIDLHANGSAFAVNRCQRLRPDSKWAFVNVIVLRWRQ